MRITRRQLVAIGAGAAASATLGRWPLLAQTGPLITKQIPSSKEAVPVVGSTSPSMSIVLIPCASNVVPHAYRMPSVPRMLDAT